MRTSPTLAGALVAITIGSCVFVAVGEIVLRLSMPDWRAFDSRRFMQKTTVPGHAPFTIGRVGFDGIFAQNDGDFRVRIRINEFGLRNAKPVAAAEGRVWVVGDSMTFGWGVERAEMYSSVIARTLGRDTYNVASPGTNVCGYQALVARMPASVKPAAVIVGLVIENDLVDYRCRRGIKTPAESAEKDLPANTISLLALKVFLTRHSALYNFVAVTFKRVNVIDRLLTALGLVEREHAYRTRFTLQQADGIIKKTADELSFLKSMLPPGTPFAVLIVPARFEIRDNDPYFSSLGEKVSAALSARGIDFINPIAEFRAAGFKAVHFAHDGHWSPLGHKIAGRAAATWLRKSVAGSPRPPTR